MARHSPLRLTPWRAEAFWMRSSSAERAGKTPRQRSAEIRRKGDIFGLQHTGFRGGWNSTREARRRRGSAEKQENILAANVFSGTTSLAQHRSLNLMAATLPDGPLGARCQTAGGEGCYRQLDHSDYNGT